MSTLPQMMDRYIPTVKDAKHTQEEKRKRLCQQQTTGTLEVNCGLRSTDTRTSPKSPAARFIGVLWRGPASFLVLMTLFFISQAGIPNTLSRGVQGTLTALLSAVQERFSRCQHGEARMLSPHQEDQARESSPGLHLGQPPAAERADGNIQGMGVQGVASFAHNAAACWDCICSDELQSGCESL